MALALVAVDFLCDVLEALDLCAALDFWLVVFLLAVEDEGVFFAGEGALSCANSPPGELSRMARKTATKRLSVLTLFSVARFSGPWACPIRYRMGSHL